MKRSKVLLMAVLFAVSTAFSQSLTDAIKLTNSEQFEKADAAFKALIQSQPNNGEVYFYYGENYFKNDEMGKANEMYQKGVDMNATSPFPYVGLGKVQWFTGKQAEAKANFYKATTLAAGKNATVLIKIAEAYINADTKNLPEAFNLLGQAGKLEPKNPEVFIISGDAYLEQNDATKAVESYEKASSLDPKSVRAILRQGQVWNRAKNYTLAIDTYKKAKLIDSTFAPAYREMAEIYLRAGQYGNAANNAKRYLDLNKDCSSLSRYSGILYQAKKYKESVDAANEALKCDSNNVYTYRYKAYSQYEIADYPGGMESINKFFVKAMAQKDFKIIPLDYEYRAKLYSKNNKDSLAVVDYKKAMELQPDKDYNIDIANAYIKMKKFQDAITVFKQKIAGGGKLGANDYFQLTRSYYYMKDFINADSSVMKVIELQPDYALGYYWRGKVNSQLDPKNEKWLAKPYYEAYIAKLKPEELTMAQNKSNVIEAYTYLGVYTMTGQKDICGAKTYFKKVVELDSSNANAKKFMDSAEAKKCP
jgi:tetratricopeptide (TPR) repeat protein